MHCQKPTIGDVFKDRISSQGYFMQQQYVKNDGMKHGCKSVLICGKRPQNGGLVFTVRTAY